MDIESMQRPMAGEPFRFAVEGGVGITNIKVFVDSELVHQHDCDDPPCHELAMIPPGTRGATLRIIATDSIGNTKEYEFQVADSDAGGASGMMTGG